MERSTIKTLLEMMDRPVFCVRDGIICLVNQAAARQCITEGVCIHTLLADQLSEYENYTGGELCLTLHIAGIPCRATIQRTDEGDLFLLEQNTDPAAQALALSAQHLRNPLQTAMTAAELIRNPNAPQDTLQQLTKGLYQIQRIISNMSDASRYRTVSDDSLETTDLVSFFAEMMEKVGHMVSLAGFRLEYTAQVSSAIGLANQEILERAIYNLLANAMKYAAPGSTLEAKLTGSGSSLRFILQDPGSDVPPRDTGNLFDRYLRQPGIEDGRHGIGLGLALVRAAAAIHGGTVLLEKTESGGTRICMTIAIRQSETTLVRAPVRLPAMDYSGGHDHALLELAEVLPSSAYKDI